MHRQSLIVLLRIFLLSFALNFVWEHLHAPFYLSYKAQPITDFILFRATLGDAVILTVLALPFVYASFFKKMKWLIVPIGIVIAIAIEIFALHTGRWVYASSMPLVPFLNVGLTPTLQLGVLGYITYAIVLKKKNPPRRSGNQA
jgi:hypothetical protein